MKLIYQMMILISIICVVTIGLSLYSPKHSEVDLNPKNYSCSNSFDTWDKIPLSCDVPNTSLKCKHSLPMKDGSILCNLDDLE